MAEEAAPSARRREERTARRERLYSAVRDAMTRAGVLSASYKFKVLSLDARGRQYLVMVDLTAPEAAVQERLAQIEASIIDGANARYDITVKAVYWRVNDQVTPSERLTSATERARASRPTPLEPPRPAAAARPEPPAAKRTGSLYDPIQADEVAAFKSALAAGVTRPAAAAAAAVGVAPASSASGKSARQAEQSYTLLTGFEDTELPDPKLRSALSGSQYGDLN